MILVLDNYDSFVHTLARYFRELDEDVDVVRPHAVDIVHVRERTPSHLVISPGPGTPAEAESANEVIRELAGSVPVLGVCLGHQCLGEVFGGRVVRGAEPVHGKVSPILHDGSGIFAGLPSPLRGTRYHSLVLERESLPDDVEVTAWTADGTVMGIRHRRMPAWGVQFHPEALLTEHGHALLANFLALGRGQAPGRVRDGGAASERFT